MEFNPDFVEEFYNEKTPLPICLKISDLKENYSTQTSHHSAALYNVFLMRQNATDIMTIFNKTAVAAMAECEKDYKAICKREGVNPIGDIKVLEYCDLLAYAEEKLGIAKVVEIKNVVMADETLDERDMSIQISDQLMLNCQELAPATILFMHHRITRQSTHQKMN